MQTTLRTVAIIAGLCLSFATQADAVDDYVRAQMERMHIPGVAIAVVQAGKPIKQQGYGFSNLELKTPVTTDSVFKIGSVSKQFIASAMVLLSAEGKLRLDDKINKYLDGAPTTWEPITIQHLLTHTSGLRRESPGFDALRSQSEAEVIKKAYDSPLEFQPGERMVYCNLGYFILAEIITKASGTPWPTFFEQRLFAPTGMHASRTTDMKALVTERADGYVYDGKGAYNNSAILFAVRPSGAFLSSINDLVKWERALRDGKLIPPKDLERMWQPTTLSTGEVSHYGFGWEVDALSGHPKASHGGSLPGFRAFYLRLLKDDLSVIVLANSDSAATDTLAIGIAENFVPGLFPKRTAITVPMKQLQAHVGQYQMGPAGTAKVELENDALAVTFGPIGKMKIVPEAANLFFLPDDRRVQVRFSTTNEGTKLEYLVNDKLAISGTKTH